MAFYIDARNKKNEVFATKSFQVWNPNVEPLYVPLCLANLYGEDFSGRGEEITVSYQTHNKPTRRWRTENFAVKQRELEFLTGIQSLLGNVLFVQNVEKGDLNLC